MVAANQDLSKTAFRIIEVGNLNLKEIREAYREILMAYNALFPLDPATRRDSEDMMDRFAEDITEKVDK